MELARLWKSRCEAIKGTLAEISQRINQLNEVEESFVIATHQPTLLHETSLGVGIYETIIFYKQKRQ